jgi:hypothetical protein
MNQTTKHRPTSHQTKRHTQSSSVAIQCGVATRMGTSPARRRHSAQRVPASDTPGTIRAQSTSVQKLSKHAGLVAISPLAQLIPHDLLPAHAPSASLGRPSSCRPLEPGHHTPRCCPDTDRTGQLARASHSLNLSRIRPGVHLCSQLNAALEAIRIPPLGPRRAGRTSKRRPMTGQTKQPSRTAFRPL